MLTLPAFRTSKQISRILEAIGDLPASARLLPQLQRLLGDERASTADIVDLLRLDPTLTAKVIGLANHAYFSGGVACATLDEAVGRLGLQELYRLVAAVAVEGVFVQDMSVYEMEEGELMDASLAVGVSMPEFNRVAGVPLRGDELFTIGLLHALGKLALSAYARIKGERRTIPPGTGSRVVALEKRLFRATHPEVGAAMLESWNFSPALIQIVRFQQEPSKAGEDVPAARLLNLAVALQPYVRNREMHGEDARKLPEVVASGLDDRKIPALIERSREMFELFSQH
jgi:HD-like signal output (HDOD) protein